MSGDELLQPHQLLQKMADFCERERIAYRIVGSMASIVYGEPRFTNDIDVLVDMDQRHITAIENGFPEPDFYLSTDAIRAAITKRTQFNILHIPSGLKLDIIQRDDSEFGKLDIAHGQRLHSEGLYDAWFASPENVILKKLQYYREGGSDKHLRDVASVLITQKDAIDRGYISEWASKLGVLDEWMQVVQKIP